LIFRNEDLEETQERRYGKKPTNYDATITFRIDSKTLEEFRKLVGDPYQPKIRDLIIQEINRHKYTYAKEEERRNRIKNTRYKA
jgi:uncharacterized protein (DUF4415 family)